jgi:EAL and modified HD-GYP domain-containing signal transduction protein
VDVFLGRQPILDHEQNVIGFELLSRSGPDNFCAQFDPVAATCEVIVNAVLAVGLDRLLGGKPAFINFDRSLLLGDWTTLLPPDKVVIEILESVEPTPEILFACQNLREKGYLLALDDCTNDDRTRQFAPFVDILKVDFQDVSLPNQAAIVERYRGSRLQFVAEKVETREEFEQACQFGYRYFQGYFFARPRVLRAARVPASNINSLRLIKQAQQPELDFNAIEQIVRHDVAFSYSLLRHLNSAAYCWNSPVESVRQALLLLGEDKIRQWSWMAVLPGLGQPKNPALISLALFRGRFCELIGTASGRCPTGADPFLLGIASLLDAILERPLGEVLGDLNISPRLKRALLGPPSDDAFHQILSTVRFYERGDCDQVPAEVLGLDGKKLNELCLAALSWTDSQTEQFGYSTGGKTVHSLLNSPVFAQRRVPALSGRV